MKLAWIFKISKNKKIVIFTEKALILKSFYMKFLWFLAGISCYEGDTFSFPNLWSGHRTGGPPGGEFNSFPVWSSLYFAQNLITKCSNCTFGRNVFSTCWVQLRFLKVLIKEIFIKFWEKCSRSRVHQQAAIHLKIRRY